MSKRYAICPVIGTGAIDNRYRPSIADVGQTNTSGLIPSNPNGTPKYGFALCIFSTTNLPAVLAKTNTYVFPDYHLDGRMDGMEADARAGMKQSVEAYNLDGQGLHLDASNIDDESYRAIMNRLAAQIQPGTNLNGFDCGEVAA